MCEGASAFASAFASVNVSSGVQNLRAAAKPRATRLTDKGLKRGFLFSMA